MGTTFFDWRTKSRCQELNPSEYDKLFFPNAGRSIKDAKNFCRNCPVFDECLEFALATDAKGIWAGTNEKERRGIKRFQAKVNNFALVTVSVQRPVKKQKRNVVFH